MKLLMESWRKYLKESKQLPELLYHGTTETFDAFDINKAGRRDSQSLPVSDALPTGEVVILPEE